ncbi:hypothetical protein BU15DRAFT_66199 [Melanogaster broomeanus]|nr:hypothetical protein BU15DRAFT_66199 [Melanogaster broomeanus]
MDGFAEYLYWQTRDRRSSTQVTSYSSTFRSQISERSELNPSDISLWADESDHRPDRSFPGVDPRDFQEQQAQAGYWCLKIPDLEVRNAEKQNAHSLDIISQNGLVVGCEGGCSKKLFEGVKGERTLFSSMGASSAVPIRRKCVTAPHNGGGEKWTTDDGGTPDVSASGNGLQTPKTRYFSVPHNPPIPYTINGARHRRKCRCRYLCPEIVGQAQMLTTFSKSFERVGLLVAADASAFSHTPIQQVTMQHDTTVRCQKDGHRRLEELKKGLGVTELPDLHVRNAEKQQARSVWMRDEGVEVS